MRIAVVGAGIAGLAAAWTLSRRFPVVLYEAADRVGGHANTMTMTLDGQPRPVDTGFLVFNRRNYPQLDALFGHLGVTTIESDMSFSASIGNGACEYRGSLRGLAAQPSRLLDPQHWQMVRDILRFARLARAFLARGDDLTMQEFLDRNRFGTAFRERYLLPMAAAIWSGTMGDQLIHPAASFLRFFDNHGLLDIAGRPRWLTVAGGSQSYVDRMIETMTAQIRTGRGVVAVQRSGDGVWLRDAGGLVERYDSAVFATHADVTLRILQDDATPSERQTLGAVRFRQNQAVLHRDASLMPKRRAAWASWNYLSDGALRPDRPVSVTYWLNRLQKTGTADQAFLTLNPLREPAPGSVVSTFAYDHPQFDADALAAQRGLASIQGRRRSWFCGAWCGHGFHEDGLQSGLSVAAALGALPPWRAEPVSPAAGIVPPVMSEAAE